MSKSLSLHRWMLCLSAAALAFALAVGGLPEAQAQQPKPNILVIMGDDIGWFNPSAYHQGMMGYQTPNIDRIAKEGARFTDWYGQQSCTAGRASLWAFLMRRSSFMALTPPGAFLMIALELRRLAVGSQDSGPELAL